MARYVIGMDLTRPHQNAAEIAEALRSLDPDSENILSNVWIVKTNLPIQRLYARLTGRLTPSDKLFITDVGTESVAVNLDGPVAPLRRASLPGVDGPASLMASLLRSILKRRSKLLTAATAESSRSA
jgi:hypothetical protein